MLRMLRRLHAWLRLRAVERDLAEELRHHRDEKSRELESRGLRGVDLEAALRRAMGNETSAREAAREVWLPNGIESMLQDLRYAVRSLRRAPAFSVSVIALLTLGIGCNLAVFSLVDRVFFRPPSGIEHPESLHRVWFARPATASRPAIALSSMAYPRARAVADALAQIGGAVVYTREPRQKLAVPATEAAVTYVDRKYFDVLGVADLGSGWPASDNLAGGDPPLIAVVSRAFAQTRFTDVASPVGRHVRIGTQSFTIVAVAPEGFTGLDLEASDIWVPLPAYAGPSWFRGDWRGAPNLQVFRVVARLNEGATGEAEVLSTIGLRRAFEGTEWASRARGDTVSYAVVAPLAIARGPGERRAEFSVASRLLIVTLLVTLIASANVASLIIARMLSRRRELAARLALGISAGRLRRLLVLEPVLLVAIATACALAATYWTVGLLESLLVPDVMFAQAPLDWRSLIVVLAGTSVIAAGVGAAVVVAIRPGALAPLIAGRSAAASSGRAHRVLLATQAALSVTLLAGASAVTLSLVRVQGIDVGWDANRLVAGKVTFEADPLPWPVLAGRVTEVAERIRGLPGVEGASRIAIAPLEGNWFYSLYWGSDSITSMGPRSPSAMPVDERFFDVSGIRVERGQALSPGDRAVVVNRAMAEMMWRGEDPIGACVHIGKREAACHRVVGVAQNATQADVIETPAAVFYVLSTQLPDPVALTQLLVRAEPGTHTQLRQALERELRAVAPTGTPVVTTAREAFAPQYRRWRIGALFFGFFAALALLVSAVGMYANVAYIAHGRRRELAVRSALGARPFDLLRSIMATTQLWVILGGVIGLGVWLIGGRVADALMYGVSSRDPRVALGALAVMIVAVTCSGLGAAAGGASVDPARVMRED